ncbi:hypothetical protein T492DRAFT_1015035 [Pavlovales sp. CCMP2436]|nr:hypothetical protein T492DRAFT_1015035 [Pavlovales sp. CCMP2436]
MRVPKEAVAAGRLVNIAQLASLSLSLSLSLSISLSLSLLPPRPPAARPLDGCRPLECRARARGRGGLFLQQQQLRELPLRCRAASAFANAMSSLGR